MSVQRMYESPRVTAPYTEEAWSEILALGRAVDASLVAGDVRLTMGGEPTFIADSDREAPEWSVDAMGPTKRRYATDLMRRLYGRFAPHGLLHEGQGKWYPGEPLPRWALSCFFRKDGLPMWHNADLFAKAGPGTDTAEDAAAFIAALARELGVEAKLALPAYEDAWHYLLSERKLPVNVDPHDAKLENPVDRARLAKVVFEQGLASVVGYTPAPPARLGRRAARVAKRPVAPASRAPLSPAGRFADGIPAPARLAALGRARRQGRALPARPLRSHRPAALAARPHPREGRAAHAPPLTRHASRCRAVGAQALRIGPRHRAERALRRAARRRASRVPPADRDSRGLPRAHGPCRRSGRPISSTSAFESRATCPRTIRAWSACKSRPTPESSR